MIAFVIGFMVGVATTFAYACVTINNDGDRKP